MKGQGEIRQRNTSPGRHLSKIWRGQGLSTVRQTVLNTRMPREGVMGAEIPNIGDTFYSFIQKHHMGIL